MATWKKVLVSGSAIEVRNITASNIPEGSTGDFLLIDSQGKLLKTGSAGGSGGGIFTNQGSYYDTENTLKVTGSTLSAGPGGSLTETRGASYINNNYAFIVSQSAYFSNHNVGHPNSLAWGSNLDGSIFSNYNASTDVAEILRTILGLMSASSAADNFIDVSSPTPNSTNFVGANVEPDGDKPSSQIAAYWTNTYIPSNYTDSTVLYLDTKGFNDGAGDSILGNVSSPKYSQSHDNFGIRLDSLPGPSTLFDAGLKDTNFTVFAIASQSFSDNQADPSPYTDSTFTTSSFFQTTQGGAGSTNGITVATINTSNPTVIPPQYQEAQFTNYPLITDRRFKASGEDFTSISASGYYRYHDIKVGIATGSTNVADIIGGAFTTATNYNGATNTYFITPLNPNDISDNSITINTGTADMFTAASRSLSGAPYLNTFTYRINNFTASGMFDPLFYGGSSNIGQITISDDIGITHTTTAAQLRSRAQGGDVDNTYQNIYDSTLTTQAAAGAVPLIDSKILYNDSLVLVNTIDEQTNVVKGATPTNTGFDLTMTIRKYNDTTTSDSITKAYHTAGTFGQPAASGALHVFMSNDGDDGSSTTQETFKGESYRRTISNSTTLTTAWDSGSRLTLGDGGDLQVKPGFLVNPEHNGTTVAGAGAGYWYPTSGFSQTAYKWYLREFTIGSATSTLVITLFNGYENDLVTWDTTTNNKFSIGLIFENQLDRIGVDHDRLRVYDIEKGTGGHSLNNQSQGNNNPFSDAIDVYGSFSGFSEDTSTDKITLTLSSAAGQVIGAGDKVWVLVRYKGAPTNTISNITLATS